MEEQLDFKFATDISGIDIPTNINNPFSVAVPEVARIAAQEFQAFITAESKNWSYDFRVQKGKMFGVLVVQNADKCPSFLGTVSGKLPGNAECNKFVSSVFDESCGDYFINKGMTELTELGRQIRNASNPSEVTSLTAHRRQKSTALQQRLFANYQFLCLSGKMKNLLQIFEQSSHGYPPSAAGECAGPKLLNYAIKHRLKAIALAEFWWGNPNPNGEREHKAFYPACKDKCRPILEYMLEDSGLFERRVL